VLIDGEDAGMIAQVSNYTGSVRIATDSGRWEFIHQLDVSRRLTQSSMPEGPGKVCAVNLDSSGVCLGVFLGFQNEKVFGGEAHAYLAHYSSKAVDRTVRTRTHGARTVGYTFAAGELVQQRLAFVEESGVRRQAVVVRVVYAPKSGRSSQIRKLLILFEVWLDGVSEPPSGCEPAFFPGSWTNWERVPESGSGWAEDVDIESPNAPCKRLKDELYPQVEEGYKKIMTDKNAPAYLTKLHAAVVYAGANQLPCEIAELEQKAMARREAEKAEKAEKAAHRAAEKAAMRANKSAAAALMKRKHESEAAHVAARASGRVPALSSSAAAGTAAANVAAATAPSGAQRKRPAMRTRAGTCSRRQQSSSANSMMDQDNETVLPQHAQHHQDNNSFANKGLHGSYYYDAAASYDGSVHSTRDAHHCSNTHCSGQHADGMHSRGAPAGGGVHSSCMHTDGMHSSCAQSFGVHSSGGHRSGNRQNHHEEGMHRRCGEQEGSTPGGSMLPSHGMQGRSSLHNRQGMHREGMQEYNMHVGMQGCGNAFGDSIQGASTMHSSTGGTYCPDDEMHHSGCMMQNSAWSCGHSSGMHSRSSIQSGNMCGCGSMPSGYTQPAACSIAPNPCSGAGLMLQSPLNTSQQPHCMGADYSNAMMRADLARATQERLENERAARVREAQLRAFYGMGPM